MARALIDSAMKILDRADPHREIEGCMYPHARAQAEHVLDYAAAIVAGADEMATLLERDREDLAPVTAARQAREAETAAHEERVRARFEIDPDLVGYRQDSCRNTLQGTRPEPVLSHFVSLDRVPASTSSP